MSYESIDETNTRLANTMFLYKNTPVYCEGAESITNGVPHIRVTFYPRALEHAVIPLSDPDLEIRRFNIGYANLPDGASYITRVPCRGHYKQGLCRENLVFAPTAPNRHRPEFNQSSRTSGFADMLLGKYPTFNEALGMLGKIDDNSGVAFEKNFAISRDEFRKDYLLHYKGNRVGFGSEGFQVPEEFRYLREVITKSGIKMR